MSTTTKTTTKTTPPTKALDAAPSDPRRPPLASPTAELKSNPLDAAATTKSPADSKSDKPDAEPAAAAEDVGADDDADETAVILDMGTFEQILDLDDDDDLYEFSLGMVQAYLSQAESTFKDMDKALSEEDLKRLSELGHFLKGSSAALGLEQLQHSCEKMQQYGKSKDATGTNDIPNSLALARITTLLVRVKKQFKEAETYLRKWYDEKGVKL